VTAVWLTIVLVAVASAEAAGAGHCGRHHRAAACWPPETAGSTLTQGYCGPEDRLLGRPHLPQEPPAPSQVFTINPDGSGRRQLTHVAADQTAGSPAWSPDGTRIAYVSNVRGDLELWVMAADGSGQHP
jgi:dipeptidyl aminopeptidase/acylaminoacyl peptidase